MEPFRKLTLDNGLILEFYDYSNRYFGDYHRVKIVVQCPINLSGITFNHPGKDETLLKAKNIFGNELLFERSLEQMGVPGEKVESVREALVENFTHTTKPYIEHPDFIHRLILSKIARQSSGNRFPGK